MTNERAREIIELMLDGIDPLTGEMLPDGHLCCYAEVGEALKAAISALGGTPSSEALPVNKKNGKLNAGRPWSEEDNKMLAQLFASGAAIDEMCAKLQRRERGLTRQLAYLGLTQPDNRRTGPSNAGRLWTAADEDIVVSYYTSGRSVSEIAAHMQRSEYAIVCRLQKLDLMSTEDQ